MKKLFAIDMSELILQVSVPVREHTLIVLYYFRVLTVIIATSSHILEKILSIQ
jgi:hypothetical protein